MSWIDKGKSMFGFATDSNTTADNTSPNTVVDNTSNNMTLDTKLQNKSEMVEPRNRSNAIDNQSELECRQLKLRNAKLTEDYDKLKTTLDNVEKANVKLTSESLDLKNKLDEAGKAWYWQTAVRVPKILFWAIFLVMIISLIILSENLRNKNSNFENKEYDPFGTSIRFSQRRDDTGSPSTSLNERKYQPMVSQLTSNPEAPNFSEYYGIDASIKNGSVMIERENFENSALSLDELEKANKGL